MGLRHLPANKVAGYHMASIKGAFGDKQGKELTTEAQRAQRTLRKDRDAPAEGIAGRNGTRI